MLEDESNEGFRYYLASDGVAFAITLSYVHERMARKYSMHAYASSVEGSFVNSVRTMYLWSQTRKVFNMIHQSEDGIRVRDLPDRFLTLEG